MTTNTQSKDNITPETTTSTQKWKYIPLSRGKRVKVSIEDYDELSKYKWYWKACSANPQVGYAARNVTIPGEYYINPKTGKKQSKQKIELMHRRILNVLEVKNRSIQCDHINHDTLDNRRENLRITTAVGNLNNHRKTKRNTSGFRGVSQSPSGKWVAFVQVNRENIRVGTFDTPQKAKREYNRVRKQLLEKHQEALQVQ